MIELNISLISFGTESICSISTFFNDGSSTRGVVTFAAPGVLIFVGPLNNVSVVLTLEMGFELFFKFVC